jgi:hypothetical protein|tara:strand:- start:116 stop:517 length:402 start_codon:yes stop_codon:yes gene_type:complete
MIPFTNINNTPNTPTKKKLAGKVYTIKGKRDKSKDFVMTYKMMCSSLFYKAAKGVGHVIYSYLAFKTGMNGPGFYPLPNKYFLVGYNISRQRKAEAVWLLEDAGLITVHKDIGKTIKVKLNVKVQNGKEKISN